VYNIFFFVIAKDEVLKQSDYTNIENYDFSSVAGRFGTGCAISEIAAPFGKLKARNDREICFFKHFTVIEIIRL
jgi:hypothetical protein